MAKLSQKQLEEMAKKRKEQNRKEGNTDIATAERPDISQGATEHLSQSKIINEIMGDKNTQLYKYSLPDNTIQRKKEGVIPWVDIKEYPELNIKGKASRARQAKPIKFYLLNEIEHILNNISNGNNKTATLNFLVWVGLQTLKGMSQPVEIRVHDETYADGAPVCDYLDEEV